MEFHCFFKWAFLKKEVAMEPPMDLISKLIPPYCLAWCS